MKRRFFIRKIVFVGLGMNLLERLVRDDLFTLVENKEVRLHKVSNQGLFAHSLDQEFYLKINNNY